MKVGEVRSFIKLLNSKVSENVDLAFAIIQGPQITSKQKKKFLEYTYMHHCRHTRFSLNDSLYLRAVLLFPDELLNYEKRKLKHEKRKFKINSNKTTKVKYSG
jgi:hypothetical protein